MKRKFRRFLATSVLTLCSLLAIRPYLAAGGEAKPDPARPAEFRPLDRWIGTWDLEVTVKPGPWAKEGTKSTFVSTISWDLNGRFLRCDAKGHSVTGDGPKVTDGFLWMCTYD